MARMLQDRDSTDSHLNTTRRHVRLCKQIKGAETLAEAIQPAYQQLQQKQADTQAKAEARQEAYDDLLLSDTDLDNAVRTTFEKCKQFDRENPGLPVLAQIFPDQTYSSIINIPREQEPDVVEKLAIRLENMGETHSLFPVAAELRARITTSRNTITAFHTAVREQKMAEAEEEIAQAALRQQYEINYLEARKLFGRQTAERLFPRLGAKAVKQTEPDTAEESGETAE